MYDKRYLIHLVLLVTTVCLVLFRKSHGDGLDWSVHHKDYVWEKPRSAWPQRFCAEEQGNTVQLKPYLQREDTTVVDADTHQLDSSTSPVHTKDSESVLVVSRKHNPKHVYGESNLEIAHSK